MWRNDAEGQVGLRLPESQAELVLSTNLEYAVNWLVSSVSEAVETIVEAGGKLILEPTQIPGGRLAVAARSEYRGRTAVRVWSPSGAGTDGRYFSAGTPAENLGAIGPGPNSVLIGHSVRLCDFCGHEPAARQLKDAGVGSECGHDTTNE